MELVTRAGSYSLAFPTVQGELVSRIRRLCDEPELRVAGAARTDAGTHALGQVVTFATSREWSPDRLLRALNRLLPTDIAISRAETVPPGFHARRSATGRIYRYQIWCSQTLSALRGTLCLSLPLATGS